ncbi:MAG: hypothetical protein QG665_97 [Patescibacteria group bacterium]|nr:hypothetical protein [Patescibacteria group bacterium]
MFATTFDLLGNFVDEKFCCYKFLITLSFKQNILTIFFAKKMWISKKYFITQKI